MMNETVLNESELQDLELNSNENTKSKSSIQKFKHWYVGAKKEDKRYCGNKLNKCQFICTHITVLLLVALLLTILVVYFAVIPNLIKSKLSESLDDFSNVLSIDTTSDTTTTFRYQLEDIQPKSLVSGTLKFEPFEVLLGRVKNFESGCMTIYFNNSIEIKLNERNAINVTGTTLIRNRDEVQNILSGAYGNTVRLKTKLTIWFWGIQFYHQLPIEMDEKLDIIPSLIGSKMEISRWIDSTLTSQEPTRFSTTLLILWFISLVLTA
ncbi:hypothetical protein BC833DRAFT_590007 [Globomyces pollinis-pini]|nr:hypothetical protein BC833DRAFT_590007 [Globomyces pollinis-pini]